MALDVATLRELFRQLQQWRSIYESDGVDVIHGPAGEEYCLWDVDYLESQLYRLPKRQREAIILYLINNMREADAAVAMGVSATNPIGIYATVGLQKLVDMIDRGDLSRFGKEPDAK
jgi:DNA-directed RNA polymerase specialized sigma24 family protein